MAAGQTFGLSPPEQVAPTDPTIRDPALAVLLAGLHQDSRQLSLVESPRRSPLGVATCDWQLDTHVRLDHLGSAPRTATVGQEEFWTSAESRGTRPRSRCAPAVKLEAAALGVRFDAGVVVLKRSNGQRLRAQCPDRADGGRGAGERGDARHLRHGGCPPHGTIVKEGISTEGSIDDEID